jgi:organic radical activating enzyme
MKNTNTSFCTLPWIHLATHPSGTVSPCCITDMENGVSMAKKDGQNLLLKESSLEEITNSESFNKLRLDMMENKFPSVCKTCYKNDSNGVKSRRFESNEVYNHLIDSCFTNTNPDGSLKIIDYRYVELRLGTVCNLKCITCNPFSSNKWNEDVSIFKNTEFESNYFKNNVKTEWYRDPQFYDDLLKKCDNLEEVWINGGEPTLIREHAYFLNKLIESGKAKDVNLHYSINVTKIPQEFIDLWMKFKKLKLQLSIDDLGERNDYIRFGSNWEVIVKNLDFISQYKNQFDIEVCQTVSALNVNNINNFKKFVMDYDLITAHNFVHHPSFMHVSILPDKMKREILMNLNFLTDDEVFRLESEMNQTVEDEQLVKFKKFTQLLDTKRKVSIKDYLPEWEEYFQD